MDWLLSGATTGKQTQSLAEAQKHTNSPAQQSELPLSHSPAPDAWFVLFPGQVDKERSLDPIRPAVDKTGQATCQKEANLTHQMPAFGGCVPRPALINEVAAGIPIWTYNKTDSSWGNTKFIKIFYFL